MRWIGRYWQHWGWRVFFVFILAFAWFLAMQVHNGVPDPDAFYHIRLAQLLVEQGLVRDFPWLSEFTMFAYSYADQHVLYHALLVPFVVWGNAIIGAKISVAVFGAIALVVMHEFLRSQRVPAAWWWVTATAITSPWLFRASLIKAPMLSLTLLVVGVWLMIRSKYAWLGVVSALYVWTYGGFVVLWGIALLWFVLSVVELPRFATWSQGIRLWWNHNGRASLRSLEAVTLGMSIGFVLHPYAPGHVAFFWTQLVDIGIRNAQDVISVGGEWYPYGAKDLLLQNSLVAGLWIVSVVAFFLTVRKQSRTSWLLLLVSMIWIALTLKSRRYIEYAVPFSMLSAGFSIRDFLTLHGQALSTFWQSLVQKNRPETIGLLGVVGLGVIALATANGARTFQDVSQSYPYQNYEAAAIWARDHLPDDALIFHDDWDVFPVLFYYDSDNRYFAGLDPTFSYVFDPNRYKEWVAITSGYDTQNLTFRIRQDFHASYALVDQDHQKLSQALLDSGSLVLYQDAFVTIFYLPAS